MTHISGGTNDAAHRLWRHVCAEADTADARAVRAEEAVERVQASLLRWVGADAYAVLLGRALAVAQQHSPALFNVRSDGGRIAGVAEVVREGEAASAAAHAIADAEADVTVEAPLVTLLAHLIDVLARIVGEDIALGLVEHAWYAGQASAARHPEWERRAAEPSVPMPAPPSGPRPDTQPASPSGALHQRADARIPHTAETQRGSHDD